MNANTSDRGCMRLSDAAAYLGVSRRSVTNLVAAGKLPVVRLTRRLILVRLRDLERMIDAFTATTGEVAQ